MCPVCVPAPAGTHDQETLHSSYHDAMPTDLRPAVSADIADVLALWHVAAAPTSTDTEEALRALLGRDPGALIVAVHAGGGGGGDAGRGNPPQIVGSVIAGWDGWRGSVYRLAVAPGWRRRGLGARLLRAAEDRLVAGGAQRCHAIVVGDDEHAVGFWQATGWTFEVGQRRYTKGFDRGGGTSVRAPVREGQGCRSPWGCGVPRSERKVRADHAVDLQVIRGTSGSIERVPRTTRPDPGPVGDVVGQVEEGERRGSRVSGPGRQSDAAASVSVKRGGAP